MKDRNVLRLNNGMRRRAQANIEEMNIVKCGLDTIVEFGPNMTTDIRTAFYGFFADARDAYANTIESLAVAREHRANIADCLYKATEYCACFTKVYARLLKTGRVSTFLIHGRSTAITVQSKALEAYLKIVETSREAQRAMNLATEIYKEAAKVRAEHFDGKELPVSSVDDRIAAANARISAAKTCISESKVLEAASEPRIVASNEKACYFAKMICAIDEKRDKNEKVIIDRSRWD